MNQTILLLSSKLPSGLIDPKAAVKLEKEYRELLECVRLRDAVGALLECADVMYYCEKSLYNSLIGDAEYREWMKTLIYETGYSEETIEAACIAKYTLRAQPGNPKNDNAERAAVIHLIQE